MIEIHALEGKYILANLSYSPGGIDGVNGELQSW
jgi:hypothetical protein